MVEKPAKPVDNGQAEPQAAVPVSFWSGKLKELAEDILLVTDAVEKGLRMSPNSDSADSRGSPGWRRR
jgi:hypothetical protein